jgi:hypothetical protein
VYIIIVGYIADELTLGQTLLRVLRFSPVSIIPPLLSVRMSPGLRTTDPLVAAVQRRSVTLSTWTITSCLYQAAAFGSKAYSSTGAYSPGWTFRLPFEVSVITHIKGHTVGLLWTSDQPVAETSTYTRQHNI